MLVGVVLANAASSGGITPISHLICGELLPLSVRPLFGNVLSLYVGGLSFVFLNVFPLLSAALGSAGLFACLAGVNVGLIVLTGCVVPETRGLSLEQVQLRHFSSRKKTVEAAGEAEAAAEAGEAIERTEASQREAEASEREAEAAENGDGGAGKEMEQREVETRRKETQIDMERCEEAEREEGKKGQQTSTEKEAERCNFSNGMHNTGQWTTVPLNEADDLDNRNQATRRIACRGTITLNNRR